MVQRRIIGGLLSIGGAVLLAVGLTATGSSATPAPACPSGAVETYCEDHWPTTTEEAAVESTAPPTSPAPTVAPTTVAPTTVAPTTSVDEVVGALPPSGGSSGTLPATGADQRGLLVLGAVCLGAGGLTLLVGRRRPSDA